LCKDRVITLWSWDLRLREGSKDDTTECLWLCCSNRILSVCFQLQ
jgi:hypothetical protein